MKDFLLVINKEIGINKKFTFEEFKKTNLYSNQNSQYLFLLNETVEIFKEIFKISFYFKNNIIKYVELYAYNTEQQLANDVQFGSVEHIENEKKRKLYSEEFVNKYWKDVDDVKITVSYNERNIESNIVIDFNT